MSTKLHEWVLFIAIVTAIGSCHMGSYFDRQERLERLRQEHNCMRGE
jgi:hypothetical protein